MALSNEHSPRPSEDQLPDRSVWPTVVLYLAVPLVIAALMAAYLVASRRAAGEFGFPLDDSWIHVRFAQNIARGYGFSFNPGQPASTTTGPLWTVVLAAAYRLTGEYLFTSAVLNWLFCWLAALTAASLARTIIPNRAFGALAALLVSVTVPLPWMALSGMEPPLSVWLTLLGILLHIRWRRAGGAKSVAPTVVFGLAVYSRPELVLLFPLALLDRLLMAAHEKREGRWVIGWMGEVAVHAPIFAAIIAPLVIYNERVIGRPLPSSYYVKAWNFGLTWALAMHSNRLIFESAVIAPLKEIGALLLMWAGNNAVLMAPFVYGFVRLVRFPLSVKQRSLLVPLLLVVQPVAWAISTNFHRPPWFQGQRYVSNLGPLYLIVGLAGAWWLWQQYGRHRGKWAAAAGLALIFAASLARQPDQAKMYALNVKNITDLQVTTARWLKRHVPRNSLLVANDVGALGAISDMRVLDLIGLVSPEIIQHLTFENAQTGAWQRLIWQEARRENADYIVAVMRPERYNGFLRSGHKPIFKIEISDNITAGGPLIVVFEPSWKLRKGPLTASTGETP